MAKSSVEQIRQRFDADVERFSNLETGQSATMDAPLSLELITSAAAAVNPDARDLLDVGCGAGNYSLKMLSKRPGLNITLIDLSQPMLERAVGRIKASGAAGTVQRIQGDVREIDLGEKRFDIILTGAMLHHLRTDEQWHAVFAAFHRALKPGGSLWVSDYISHSIPAVQKLMWERFGEYLARLKDEAYRDKVFAYIEEEDTPRSLDFQLDLLRQVGFAQVEVLHKNSCFAAFGAVRGS